MAENHNHQLCVTIPTYFKCPISLEIMKSPVSLSTGVTYDRSSIQPWLENGHRICPATMQSLSDPTFIPNLTLHRLIHLWSLSHSLSPPSPRRILLPSSDSQHIAFSLGKILDRVRNSEDELKVLENSEDFLSSIVKLLVKIDEVKNLELIFSILSYFDGEKIKDLIVNVNCLPKFVVVLRNGSEESKIAVSKIVQKIAVDKQTKQMLIETQGVFLELYNLISWDYESSIEAGLSALIALSSSKSAKINLVKLGIVQRLAEILSSAAKIDAPSLIEKSMEMLELVSTCTEGRSAICEEERCVVEIVKKLMKVSEKATEHGVTVLWSVCYLFRDEKVKEVLGRSNGLGKCLVLLQSNCKPIVKQMCGDLVKVLRVNYKSCLGGYDTKTTHIMPY